MKKLASSVLYFCIAGMLTILLCSCEVRITDLEAPCIVKGDTTLVLRSRTDIFATLMAYRLYVGSYNPALPDSNLQCEVIDYEPFNEFKSNTNKWDVVIFNENSNQHLVNKSIVVVTQGNAEAYAVTINDYIIEQKVIRANCHTTARELFELIVNFTQDKY